MSKENVSLSEIANRINIQGVSIADVDEDITEDDLIAVITKIAELHNGKTFAYYESADIEGEVWLICLRQLQYYEPSRGKGTSVLNSIERWLNRVVKNRLANLYRDRYSSVNQDYRIARMNIMNSLPFDSVDISKESKNWGYWENHMDPLLYKEFFKFIEDRVPEELIDVFYDCVYEENVSSYYRNKLKVALQPILVEWNQIHLEDAGDDDEVKDDE